MKNINCKQVLVNFEGKPLKIENQELTVGSSVSLVLSGQTSNPTLAWILGNKFSKDETIDLKAEEITFIKKEMSESKHWTSIVSGQVIEILDGSNAKKD